MILRKPEVGEKVVLVTSLKKKNTSRQVHERKKHQYMKDASKSLGHKSHKTVKAPQRSTTGAGSITLLFPRHLLARPTLPTGNSGTETSLC